MNTTEENSGFSFLEYYFKLRNLSIYFSHFSFSVVKIQCVVSVLAGCVSGQLDNGPHRTLVCRTLPGVY